MAAFCVHCGTQLHEAGAFCHACGKPKVTAEASIDGTAAQPAPSPEPQPAQPEKSSGAWIWVVVIVVALLICLVVLFASNSGNTAGGKSNPIAQLTKQRFTAKLPQNAFTVSARGFQSTRFVVPEGATDINVEGRFSATGGSGNDVEVFLLDEDGYVNFQNNHRVGTYFNSGRATQGGISVSLPKHGTYYLVFNNRFSVMSPKAVQADATLSYLK